MDSTAAEQLLEQWKGQIVPRSFNAGFVTLSYVVSLIGAASTLELINRRTAPKGKLNHLLLVSAAITMGGIAIWCMHYIGNRAIDMADGEDQLQITYSSGFTALSFFLPIMVLVAAFVAMGTNDKVSWWRVTVGGTLAGAAICGMHYLGNASINNYVLIYSVGNVVGATLISVAASIIALAAFFVFRGAWTNSWWKRGISAVVLAGAVSGMHWCASTGTEYRLIALAGTNSQLSRTGTVIIVSCLSVGACLVMAGFATYTARTMKRYANKAQQIVLAAAVFDKHGRVLVSPDGLLPSEKITDSFLEKTPQDSFTVAHPLFHWMFQASRNWSSITSIIVGISSHLSHLPRNGRDNSRRGIKLVSDHGELIENYNIIFRELFCAAAAGLADKMKTPLANVGILWDEILPTGAGPRAQARARQRQDSDIAVDGNMHGDAFPITTNTTSLEDLAEKGVFRQPCQELGRGSLMFLVRRVENTRDMENLTAAGYRFAELHQVSGIIGSTMQIKTQSIESKMRMMLMYATEDAMLEPGVHVGFFGVRARVNNAYGFDVLARREAHNLLPSVQMPLARLDAWQMNFLRQLERMTPHRIVRRLECLKSSSPKKEMIFASQLTDSIETLGRWIEDSFIFNEAVLCSKTVEVPCRPASPGTAPGTCTVIAFRMVIPIHLHIESPKCEFVPLNLFKVHQLVYKDLPNHLVFTRSVHRELAPIINAVPVVQRAASRPAAHLRHTPLRNARSKGRIFRIGRPCSPGSKRDRAVDADGNPIPTVLYRSRSGAGSGRSSSILKLWSGRASNGGDLSPRIGSVDSVSDRYHRQHRSPPSPPPAYPTEDTHSPISSPHTPDAPPLVPPNSFGGIMVSQEITVNVQTAGDISDMEAAGANYSSQGTISHSRSRSLLLHQRRASEGGPGLMAGEAAAMASDGRRGTAAADVSHFPGGRRTASIELRSLLPADRSSVHMGSGVQVSNVEAEKLTDSPTFVDELFGFCVEGR
ncbi:Signaling protein YkoW [Cytospora mali]|uniref:Signaling protein YkoW n=1 Tax=Cytospora mali TaxID=578113 RepID=A0A194V7S9_CYTMA|nr:Signaling protein YkoW [Valsa mali var. pyri (nom. inval.)]